MFGTRKKNGILKADRTEFLHPPQTTSESGFKFGVFLRPKICSVGSDPTTDVAALKLFGRKKKPNLKSEVLTDHNFFFQY